MTIPIKYNLTKPWLTLDPWQREILERPKSENICIVSGRQCGKSTVVSLLAAMTAVEYPNQFILIGARDIEQAEMIFWKIKEYIWQKHPKKIVGKATLNYLHLKNGSKIICKAIGDTGAGMRGPTATMVIIDEAAFVPDRAWVAIEPVISVTKGRTILLSTPQGKQGFFYKASINKKEYFTKTISARNCPRHTEKFLNRKQKELSPVAFATEYLGEFIDDYNRKFSKEWIDQVCVINKKNLGIRGRKNVLGIDVAGEGPDDTTFEGFDATNTKNIRQTLNLYSPTISGPKIERQIETLNRIYHYNRKTIGFDSGGMGSGVFQYLLDNNKLKRCMVALDNATRPVEAGAKGQRKKLLKEYMYDLVEEMGWRGELKCFNDSAVKQSFESIQVEFKSNGERRYWGAYAHIVEGINRAVWVAKNKTLNIMPFCQ